MLLFSCSHCRKTLKADDLLAGKPVACPQCGMVMLVPLAGEANADAPTDAAPTLSGSVIPAFLIPPAWLILTLVLLAAFCLQLHHLDHTALTRWDEVFHAVVAQNVFKHPFKPTLVDVPYLPYDMKKWGENHIWLHKPILTFWQIALSFAVLGVNAFALRLPSAVLSTAAAGLTYLIGKELFDRRAALIAATLQAVNPFLLTLVHGYQFADHIDVALLFWVEVGMYFLIRSLRTASWRDVLLAGVAQGLAYLCKSYLAGIILGVALTAWLLPLCRLGKREELWIGFVRLVALLGATLLTVAPWLIWCLTQYPHEFWYEDGQVWKHLHSNVETWAAPWDRLVFDYLIAIYGFFYTPVLVALIVSLGKAVIGRNTGSWLLSAWGLGVLLPHLFAVTKTPSATIIAVPALLLLLGQLVSDAWRGERWSLFALTGVLVMSLIFPALVKRPGYGFPASHLFGAIMSKAMWVTYHVVGALVILADLALVWLLTRHMLAEIGTSLIRYVRGVTLLFCLAVLAWLGLQTFDAAWLVTNTNQNEPSWVDVGHFARDHLPENAVLLCEERNGYEHLIAMFYADRTCYALAGNASNEMARRIVQAGGKPYVVTGRKLPLEAVYMSGHRGLSVYQWRSD